MSLRNDPLHILNHVSSFFFALLQSHSCEFLFLRLLFFRSAIVASFLSHFSMFFSICALITDTQLFYLTQPYLNISLHSLSSSVVSLINTSAAIIYNVTHMFHISSIKLPSLVSHQSSLHYPSGGLYSSVLIYISVGGCSNPPIPACLSLCTDTKQQ